MSDINGIIEPGNVLLKRPVLEVPPADIPSAETQMDIDRMLQIAAGERGDIEKGVMIGLAAPQIGINKRIILVDTTVGSDRRKLGHLAVYINPEITWFSEDQVFEREGCFSVDRRVAGIVQRPKSIKLKAYDRFGNRVYEEYSCFTARIFQHEIDHLNGIRFPDRIGEKGVLHWVEIGQYPEYRKQWRHWPHTCPWAVWIAMKEGRPYEAPK